MHEVEGTLSRFLQIYCGTFKTAVDRILQKYGPVTNTLWSAKSSSIK